MNPARLSATVTWLTVILLILGCSSHRNDPISPSSDLTPDPLAQQGPVLPDGGPVLWGVWDCVYDYETGTIETVPVRTSEFTTNIVQYLQPPMGSSSNLTIAVTDTSQFLSQGKITLDIAITHPFPLKPQFTGFDVMGVLQHNGSHSSTVGWNNLWPRYPTDAVLLNHDGYTRWMNQSEFTQTGLFGFTPGTLGTAGTFTGTVNPYKYFADGLSKTQSILTFFSSVANVGNRGLFSSGSTNTREFQLQFPMVGGKPVVNFQYIVLSRWDTPSPNPPVNIPGDFPASASCQEAFYIEVRDAGSTLNYHPAVGGSGDLRIDVEVFDWQGASNPIGFSDELSSLFVEGFNVWIQPPTNFANMLGIATESPGSCANSRIYHVYMPNCVPTKTGTEELMINIQSNNPATYDSGMGSIYPASAALSGYTVASIPVSNFSNSTPVVPTPTGPSYIWEGQTIVFTTNASDADGDNMTFTWSIVPTGISPNYIIPGDPPQPNTNTLTVKFNAANGYAPGTYDISCKVQDDSGASNDTGFSPSPLIETVYVAPYSQGPPANQWDQIIVGAPTFQPSLQGMWACPMFHDGFYAPIGTVTLTHADVTILSGPSLGIPGVMCIADEFGVISGIPSPPMGFVTFTCPYQTGNPPSWSWMMPGPFPGGPDMLPSCVHFDATSNSEYLTTSGLNPGPGKLGGINVPDASAFQHYHVPATPATWVNDLYTSLPSVSNYDIAADATNGFDHGSPGSPATPPLYGLFTQEQSGILNWCIGTGPIPPLDLNPVNFMLFPSMGTQPAGTPVDTGGPGIIAQLPFSLVSNIAGSGGGIFCIGPGGVSPSGGLVYPDPYYALAVDDDPADNPWTPGLPSPAQWTLAAAIDADRDLEIYEIDFGVATPAPLLPWSSLTMGSFLGGSPTAYPLDCEFIPNFSNFGGTTKHVSAEDLLAVLITDPGPGVIHVEIYVPTPGTPTLVSITPPLPTPPMNYGVPGVAYRLDVDEVTGDIYVLHESGPGGGGLGVTIFSY